MFGKNSLKGREMGDGRCLRVVAGSPFYTVQGEGPFAGMPAVFIRLHGCPLRCYFCDTNFDDPADPVVHVGDIASSARKMTPGHCSLAVITGGEPTRQNLMQLVGSLNAYGFTTVQIETAGIFWQEALRLPSVSVVVSPKTGSVNPDVAKVALAWKYIIKVGDVDPSDGLPILSTQFKGTENKIARPPSGTPKSSIWLSPCDEYNDAANTANAKLVAELSMTYGYRAGVQMHKILRVD